MEDEEVPMLFEDGQTMLYEDSVVMIYEFVPKAKWVGRPPVTGDWTPRSGVTGGPWTERDPL